MKVLVVDDSADTREHVAKLISLEPDIDVVGMAGDGGEAVDLAVELQPDVVLMDINMPNMDGIEATDQMSRKVPQAAIIMLSIQGDADYLRRSMLAGAREFLVKPFGADELVSAMRAVHERSGFRRAEPVPVGPGRTTQAPAPERRGKVVALYSPKGGVGRSTLAVNMAVAATTQLRRFVTLVDASLQFGDIGLLMNIDPNGISIADILTDISDGRADAIEGSLVTHASGVKVLLPPPSPEVAELVGAKEVRAVLDHLRQSNELVIVDTWPLMQEPTLSILDAADVVLCVMTLDLTSIKSTRMFLGVADKLGYADQKLRIVLNRADSAYGISVADVERSIGRRVDHTVASDARTVVNALNRGTPFVTLSGQAQISRDVSSIVHGLVDQPPEAEPVAKPSRLGRRLAFAGR